MDTAPGTSVSGFCYVGRNGRGHEFLIPGSFGTSRTKSKRRLDNINRIMGADHRPMLEPVALVVCTMTVHSVIKTFDEASEGKVQ